MAAPRVQIVLDAADPDALGRFWAEVLGYVLQPPPQGYASWDDWLREHGIPEERWNDASAIVDPDGARPRIFIQRVPEPKTAKNRCHIDVQVGTRDLPPEEGRRRIAEAVERALALGASKLWEKDERGEYWVTLADPEGNEFCIT